MPALALPRHTSARSFVSDMYQAGVSDRMRPTLSFATTALLVTSAALSATDASAQSGSVTVIQATDGVYTDVAELLQGRVAGLVVAGTDGQVGAASTIRIRGNNSIELTNHPVVYVDGVRIENEPLLEIRAAGTGTSALDAVNPGDIERVEIVRGPAASVLYGPDASAGVILITTRHGETGRPRWTMTVDGGRSRMGHMGPTDASDVTPISNAYTEAALPTGDFDVDYLLDGEINPTGLALNDCRDEPGCPFGGSWFRDAYLQRYGITAGGGSATASYFASGRWTQQEGVVDGQGREGYDLRSNLRIRPHERLDVTIQGNYSQRTIGWIPNGNNDTGLFLNVIRGDRGMTPNNDDSLVLFEQLTSSSDQWLGTVAARWRPGAGLSHRLTVRGALASGQAVDYQPYGHFMRRTGMREVERQDFRALNAEYLGRWEGVVDPGLTASIDWGAQYFDRRRGRAYLRSEDFPGPLFGLGFVGNGALNFGAEEEERARTLGFLVQGSVHYRSRLSLSAGLRWDDYSSLGVLDRGYFRGYYSPGVFSGFTRTPRLAASYRVSEESFFSAVPFLDDLVVRAGWGRAAAAPTEAANRPIYEPVLADESVPGLRIGGLGNPDLAPELTSGTDIGIDLSAFDERIRVGFTHFDQRTDGALIRVQEAPSFGTPESTLRTLGETTSAGIETSLRVEVLREGRFLWAVSGTYATNDATVTDLGPLDSGSAGVRIGQPLHVAVGDVVANPDEGGVVPTFRTEALGPLWPTKLFGIGSSLVFDRSLTLDVLGEGQLGHVRTIAVGAAAARVGTWPGCSRIQERFANTGINALRTQQLATCVPQYIRDGMWTDRADFFRVRSVSLSYRLPTDLIAAAPDVVISFQVKNLLTLTDYQGLDPEAIDQGLATDVPVEFYNMPPPRTLVLRVRAGF